MSVIAIKQGHGKTCWIGDEKDREGYTFSFHGFSGKSYATGPVINNVDLELLGFELTPLSFKDAGHDEERDSQEKRYAVRRLSNKDFYSILDKI
jgi:hypothetical protein